MGGGGDELWVLIETKTANDQDCVTISNIPFYNATFFYRLRPTAKLGIDSIPTQYSICTKKLVGSEIFILKRIGIESLLISLKDGSEIVVEVSHIKYWLVNYLSSWKFSGS